MNSSNFVVGSWILLSIVSSTSLILLLKGVKPHLHCQWTVTLSTLHFLSTWISLLVMAAFKFIRKTNEIPLHKRFLLAFLVMTSIISMNFNLTNNSIGFYQMSKLVCIPYMIVYNMVAKNQRYTNFELISLAVLISGVGIFSVSDVELNVVGTIYAAIAVLSTAHNQMLTGSFQAEYHLNGPELQLAVIPFEFILGVLCSFGLEGKSFFAENLDSYTIWLMAGTCVFAVGVNVATFGLIGKTSSVTYQVVGHLKTVLLLIFGYILFPSKWESTSQMIRAMVGICTALAGVFMYTKARLDIQKKNLSVSENKPLISKGLNNDNESEDGDDER
ncbi:phosphate translocator protein [Tritrichomonas foetus]|uniref:Phosphate translocator protein n=1 Tax=Tritrichomonas foetus TaxID=1144522 RepID=A0A1J4KNE6_9EUKA|nr:phosphate translocator protein [Tritrichomonas foetus]|eukprot:OHT11308.1 phosphate translocator protein [Tritrichomonas foetus]